MKAVLNILVSAAVLALLLWWAGAEDVLARLRGASIGWLALAAVSLTVLTILMARRWQIVAGTVGIDMRYGRALSEYYIAQLVNLVLPGGVAGDVARAVRARHAASFGRAAQSVAAERIVGQVVMFTVAWVGLAVALLVPGGIAWPLLAAGALAAGLIVVALVFWLSRSTGATGRFLRVTLGLLGDFRILLLSLVITALLIFSFYACAHATGTVIPPEGWFTLIPFILSAMVIPLSVGGWGWREGAAAALFPLIGAAPDAGIAAGIAYGAMMLIAALPGVYFVVRETVLSRPDCNKQMEI